MDALLAEEMNHDYLPTNYTVKDKFNQMYIMMKVITCMVTLIVGVLFTAGLSVLVAATKFEQEQKAIDEKNRKIEEKKKLSKKQVC